MSVLATSLLLVLSPAAVQPLAAQTTTNVTGPANLGTSVPTLAPGAGDVWNLSGPGIYLAGVAVLPAGSPGLTINGDGVNPLTLNNSSVNGGVASTFGLFVYANTSTTLNLSNITITGGSGSPGGAIEAITVGDLNIASSSSFSFVGNRSSSSGGAIFANGNLSLNAAGNIIISGNTSSSDGGAIFISNTPASVNETLSLGTVSGNVFLTDNHAQTGVVFGGAIFSLGHTEIGNSAGTVTISANSATYGGAIYSASSLEITGGFALSNNAASTAGGALYSLDIMLDATANSSISGNMATIGGAIFCNTGGNVALNATGGNINVTGNSASVQGGAINANCNAALNATGGNITFSGNTQATATAPQANAMYFDRGGSTATFNAATGQTITFFDPIANNAANGMLNVVATGPGAVVFDGSQYANPTDRWSQVYGTTEVQGGTFAVQNDAIYGVLAADVGQTSPTSFTVDAGATLAGGIAGQVRADNFVLDGTLNIAGAAPPGSASGGFSNFTVTSNNVSFGAGSQVLFNTYLNDGSTQLTDLLTLSLNGSATSGTASVLVTNVGGPGGLTTGNGIELVQASTGTTNGAFTLDNPELRAGAYDYRLFQGPLVPCAAPSPAAREPMVPQCENWFLRSTFIEEPPVEPPVTPPEVLPPTPPTPGPGLFPIIGPEIATYGVVQPMAQQLGRAMLGTHDDRLGDLYPVPCEPMPPIYIKTPPIYTKAPTVDCSTDGFRLAVWGRVFGQQIDNHYQAFADPRTDGQIAGLQVGMDVVRSDELIPGHKDYGGFYFAYGNANADVTGLVTNAASTAYVLQHTGSLNLNAYSGGAYWTHYGVPGWYVDLTLQGTSYNGGASTEFASLKTTGTGFISSLEGGYPIAMPQLGWGFVLEPQAQVLWQWVSFDSGNDGLGPVALGTTSETTARVGLKGKWTITTNSGQVWQPNVNGYCWHLLAPKKHCNFSLFRCKLMPVNASRTSGA